MFFFLIRVFKAQEITALPHSTLKEIAVIWRQKVIGKFNLCGSSNIIRIFIFSVISCVLEHRANYTVHKAFVIC
jgi:hypothetical protein